MHALDETIVAIASPPGGGARGIVRVSGQALRPCLERCFRPDPPAPMAGLSRPTVVSGVLWLTGFTSSAPCELYLWPGTRSYTGQPVAEIHTLGSPPLLESIVRAICSGGARPAEPGEFTLRAFLAGRIDLTQAEAVLGVIDATGSAELDAALKQLAGGLAAPLQRIRGDLLELLAHLEAGFDFTDEDLQFITTEELHSQLEAASLQVSQLVEKLAFRGEAATRVRVALVGPPNAGKSSLFNALAAGKHGAIVSDQPGTTRDYLTADLNLDGVKCELIDTAGMDDLASEAIERAAQTMTHEQYRTAHVRVVCVDTHSRLSLRESCATFAERKATIHDIPVLTKHDLAPSLNPEMLRTSVVTGEGIEELKAAIRAAVLQASAPQSEVVAGTAVRCGESLRMSAASIDRARAAVSAGLGEELIAAEVRIALNELGKVAGVVYTEDVLDRIFSRFCIGK